MRWEADTVRGQGHHVFSNHLNISARRCFMFRKNYVGVSVLVLGLVLTASVPAFAKLTPHAQPQPDVSGFGGFGLNPWAGKLRTQVHN